MGGTLRCSKIIVGAHTIQGYTLLSCIEYSAPPGVISVLFADYRIHNQTKWYTNLLQIPRSDQWCGNEITN